MNTKDIIKELGDCPASCAVIELLKSSGTFAEVKIADAVDDAMQDYRFFDDTNVYGDGDADFIDREIIAAIDFLDSMGRVAR